MKRLKKMILLSVLAAMLSAATFTVYAEPTSNETAVSGANNVSGFEALLAQYEGVWWDLNSQRCYMNITPYENQLLITVHWGNGAFETSEWGMTAVYDEGSAKFRFNNCISKTVYTDENENSTEAVHYIDGTGTIYIADNGYLYWEDNTTQAGALCYFEKEKKAEWTGTYISSDDQTIIVSAADHLGVVLTFVGYSEEGWYSKANVLPYRDLEKTQVSDAYYYNGTLVQETIYTVTETGINVQVLPGGGWAEGFYFRQ